MKCVRFGALLLFALATVASVVAQVPPPKDPEAVLSKSYTGKSYSPYAERGFPSQPFWGDTHLHTDISMDAGAFGNRLGLDDAYRFARGDEVVSTNGTPARLSRPLDFLVIADHSDNMGFFPALRAGERAHRLGSEGTRLVRTHQGGRRCQRCARADWLVLSGQVPPRAGLRARLRSLQERLGQDEHAGHEPEALRFRARDRQQFAFLDHGEPTTSRCLRSVSSSAERRASGSALANHLPSMNRRESSRVSMTSITTRC